MKDPVKEIAVTPTYATAVNAVATATVAAGGSGVRHYITGVVAGYLATASGTLTLKRGTTTISVIPVYNQHGILLKNVIQGNDNEAVSAELAAGGAGIVGHVTLLTYSL